MYSYSCNTRVMNKNYDSFHYLADVISCGGGVELAVRDRIILSGALSTNGGNW